MSTTKLNPNNCRANNEEANYLSLGCRSNSKHGPIDKSKCTIQGCFKFEPDQLFEYIAVICDTVNSKDYCFAERRTNYFMFYVDLDVDKHIPDEMKDNPDDLINHIINKLEELLEYYILIDEQKDELKYIYSNKLKGLNTHLYFPKIILNEKHALTIRDKLIENIVAENKFNLSNDTYINIIDESVYKSAGLKPLFQKKPHEKLYYVINQEKSTYQNIPNSKIGQLRLTAIRRQDKAINFELNCDPDGCPLLINDMEIYNNRQTMKNNITKTKKNAESTVKLKTNKATKPEDGHHKEFKLRLDIPEDMLKELFDNIKSVRYTTYANWIKIMFLCMNYNLLKLAHSVSLKCPTKYDKIVVDRLFAECKNTASHSNVITVRSLYSWSKEDNKEQHKLILDKYYTKGYFKEVEYDVINELRTLPYCEIYDAQFLKQLDIKKHQSFIVKASLGTNKTGETIKSIVNITEREEIDKICCMASRVVLCSDLSARFKENLHDEKVNRPMLLGMDNYFPIKKDLWEYLRLVQTPDSLHRMFDNTGKIKHPDILFIDEIESLLEYVCTSDTLKLSRTIVFDALCHYIKYAKYVFLVDGNLSKHIVEFLYKLRDDKNLKFIYNDKKTDDNKYYFIKNESDWSDKLNLYLTQNKIVYIPTDSKDYSEYINKHIAIHYPNYKVQLYNSDTSDEHKINLGNVNETWKKHQAIIVSPTILYGVNFSEIHFDAIFGWYQTTILPGSVYQQLRRIRYIKDKEVFIYLKDQKYEEYYPTSTSDLRIYVQENIKQYTEIYNSLKLTPGGCLELDIENTFTSLFLYFLKERNKANTNYLMELIIKINEWGGKCFVEVKKGKRNIELEKEKKSILDELKEDKIKDLLDANIKLNESDSPKKLYEESNSKIFKSIQDKNIIIVYHMRQTFRFKTINEAFLKDLGKLTNINKFEKSLIYFGNDKYKTQIINYSNSSEFKEQSAILFRQMELIKECVKLFWPDGLLSTNTIKIYSGKDTLETEHAQFIKTHEKELRLLFFCLKRSVKPKYPYQLFKWLEAMITEFFGGFIKFSVSKKEKEFINKEDDKRTIYYCVSILQSKYIELVSNKNRSILSAIPASIEKAKCIYESLHGYHTIKDFYENTYDFILEPNIGLDNL